MTSAITVPKHWRSNVPTISARRHRILVVDDSVVVRRLLMAILSNDPELEVVGVASSAARALEKLVVLKPDLVTLDINMPGMSGLDLLPILRNLYPALRVLIFSCCDPIKVSTMVDAKMLGATDYISKSSDDVSLGNAVDRLHHDLVPRIKLLLATPVVDPSVNLRDGGGSSNLRIMPLANAPFTSEKPRIRAATPRRPIEPKILAIGVSTGGPTALATFMAGIPASFPLPILIVQHMPPVFTRLLADRLSTLTGFNVVEATHDMPVEPGRAILAPGDYHMRLVKSGDEVRIVLDQGPQECSCRPSVDVLFRSVQQVYDGAVIAAVLTGMGQDGLCGARILKEAGAYLVVQDEASSVVWGMPGAIANSGLADEILDLTLMTTAILKKVGH